MQRKLDQVFRLVTPSLKPSPSSADLKCYAYWHEQIVNKKMICFQTTMEVGRFENTMKFADNVVQNKFKLIAVIRDRQLVSYANSTRWGLFFSDVEKLKLKAHIKWIFEDSPSEWSNWIVPTENYVEHFGFGLEFALLRVARLTWHCRRTGCALRATVSTSKYALRATVADLSVRCTGTI